MSMPGTTISRNAGIILFILCRIAATIILLRCLYLVFLLDPAYRLADIPPIIGAAFSSLYLIISLRFRKETSYIFMGVLSISLAAIELLERAIFITLMRSSGYSFGMILKDGWPSFTASFLFITIFVLYFFFAMRNHGGQRDDTIPAPRAK